MPHIFVTEKAHPYDVEIAGVGVIGGSARGGIPVERAAESVRELQDANGKPLSGKDLESAAAKFASGRGLAVKSLKNVDEEKLRVDAGAFPRGRTIEEIAGAVAERDFGQLAEHEAPGAAPLTPDALPPQTSAILPEPPGSAD